METVFQIVTELNPDINNWSENDATKVSETNWVSWGESSTQDHNSGHRNGLLRTPSSAKDVWAKHWYGQNTAGKDKGVGA